MAVATPITSPPLVVRNAAIVHTTIYKALMQASPNTGVSYKAIASQLFGTC
ncbi:hypothetical protein IQ247_06195 [Plectonema cf. radiosum LEGE 06105]|uniref:Uncharacterized protein n=1 Tax=Plectonema cf. radiosum LEGE 06105 TaxID=945769 RepID=A0A8J7EY95_9CYAN|nr:hypothetical protein [Plectonema radiosum]MBE9212301.1 hypothetical protein [Plectonema cf. radiosum LEGE 06105]